MINLENDYYRWLVDQIKYYIYDVDSYQLLLQRLFEVEYYALNSRDENRIADGMNLVHQFKNKGSHAESFIFLGEHDYCSVLELLIALAMRIEDDLMYDPDKGDRTSAWFWIMIENLELDTMHDDAYDQFNVDSILHSFIEHQYDEKGNYGNIFYTNMRGVDFRTMEISSQKNYYFDEFMEQMEDIEC